LAEHLKTYDDVPAWKDAARIYSDLDHLPVAAHAHTAIIEKSVVDPNNPGSEPPPLESHYWLGIYHAQQFFAKKSLSDELALYNLNAAVELLDKSIADLQAAINSAESQSRLGQALATGLRASAQSVQPVSNALGINDSNPLMQRGKQLENLQYMRQTLEGTQQSKQQALYFRDAILKRRADMLQTLAHAHQFAKTYTLTVQSTLFTPYLKAKYYNASKASSVISSVPKPLTPPSITKLGF